MTATKDHRIEITEKECVKLIEQLGCLDVVFGPSFTALIWKKGEPMPPAVEFIGRLRGVLNENTEGAGI